MRVCVGRPARAAVRGVSIRTVRRVTWRFGCSPCRLAGISTDTRLDRCVCVVPFWNGKEEDVARRDAFCGCSGAKSMLPVYR